MSTTPKLSRTKPQAFDHEVLKAGVIVAGFDPGLGGGVCILDATRSTLRLKTYDIPIHQLDRGGKAKREVDIYALADLLTAQPISHGFVEAVSARPGQGTVSMFTFGKAYGIVLGILGALDIPVTLVSPVVWKKALQCPRGKHASRARASQLLPAAADQWKLTKHDGRAEAALIAYYGLHVVRH